MTRLWPLSVLALLAACSSETPPPATPKPPPPAATPAPPPPPAPPPATAAPKPPPPAPADLGQMSNDPETDKRMRAEVMKSIQPSRREMRTCYNDALRKNAKLSGEITIRLTVAPSGEPVVIDDEGSTVKDKEFVDCVRAVLSNIHTYPKWQGKAVTVIVPLEFFRQVEASGG